MTAAAITTLRTTIATALTNDEIWSVSSYPRPTLLANSVSVLPGDPYLEPTNDGYNTVAPLANFKILMAVPALDNQGNLADIETYIIAVFNKLAASSLIYNVTSVSTPSITDAASGSLLTAEINLSILTTWS